MANKTNSDVKDHSVIVDGYIYTIVFDTEAFNQNTDLFTTNSTMNFTVPKDREVF